MKQHVKFVAFALIIALVICLSGCSGGYTEEDLQEAYNEGYEDGYEYGIEKIRDEIVPQAEEIWSMSWAAEDLIEAYRCGLISIEEIAASMEEMGIIANKIVG